VAGSPVIGRRRGAFSTLLRRPGLRASSDGVLATKSERKMLASTCLYSLYAWFWQHDTSVKIYYAPVGLLHHCSALCNHTDYSEIHIRAILDTVKLNTVQQPRQGMATILLNNRDSSQAPSNSHNTDPSK